MNIRFDDSILQDFGDLCSTFFSSTPMFSIEPFFIAASFRPNGHGRKNGFLLRLCEAAHACDITLNFSDDYSIMRKNGGADMPYNRR